MRDEGKGTYGQFVFGQSIPTCCAVVLARSIDVEFYVAIQPAILYPLIDRMLGAKESDAIPQRPISEIERGLSELILGGVLAEYEDAWRPVLSFDLTLHRIEYNLQRRCALAGSEETYRVRYSVRFGCHAGFVELCLPWRKTQQVRQRLAVKPRALTRSCYRSLSLSSGAILLLDGIEMRVVKIGRGRGRSPESLSAWAHHALRSSVAAELQTG